MSYRELRNMCEMTRSLGYPRLLSIENFRTPNFKLVAELLEWIVSRFDPTTSLNAQQIETETERVVFVKQAVLTLLQNSRLKLNPKKLYQADGHAVQELLPAIRLLYDAARQSSNDDLQTQWANVKNKLNTKMQDVRVARHLATQLPQTGAALHDLLSKELYYRPQRLRASGRSIPLADAEKAVKQSVAAIADEAGDITTKLNNVASDEAALDEKIERKKREYEQMQKRFAKLQSFRPQYMDEYERYEAKLQQLYEEYVIKFRNLTYLQQLHVEIEKFERIRQEESERTMRQVVEKMKIDTINTPPVDVMDEVPPIEETRRQSRRVFGNMAGTGVSDEDSDEDAADLLVESDVSDDDEIPPGPDEDDKRGPSSGDDF